MLRSAPDEARGLAGPESHRARDLVGLALVFVGAAVLLWLLWPQDAPVPTVAEQALRWFAGAGAYAAPIILIFLGVMLLVGCERLAFTHSTIGSVLLFLTFLAWRHLAVALDPSAVEATGSAEVAAWSEPHLSRAGGVVGAAIGWALERPFGLPAAYLFLTMTACMGVVLLVDQPFVELLRRLRAPARGTLAVARTGVAVVRERAGALRERRESRTAHAPAPASPPEPLWRRLRSRVGPNTVEPPNAAEEPFDASDEEGGGAVAEGGKPEPDEDDAPTAPAPRRSAPASPAPPAEYVFPPLTLLHEPPAPAPRKAQQEMAEKRQVLERTLEQFGIKANVVEIAHGPTVTRYEIQLAPGIKVSRIVSLADNLAMSLAAIDVRVEAPIPGKAAIGVEVPNAASTVVTLRECLEAPEFQSAPGKLVFALGKDVSGAVRFADLTKMPHLLIGGATNSGKSACLNSLIASFVYRARPDEVKLVLVDPKRVELSLWEGIPHLLYPVVKDVRNAAGILRAVIKEMEARYDAFARAGTRNIEGYNRTAPEDQRMPYLVIVVDELADLMMQAAGEVEPSICRIAQLARATGIHLVIATQRPSVDVITGTIKANISSRIAFAVSSQVDSRTIIDMVGADRLIGRGDMLFLPIDAGKPTRIQGCYLSEAETHALVEHLRRQGTPAYRSLPDSPNGSEGPTAEAEDDLFENAVKLIASTGHGSTSLLQRRFRIGYTRAARLLDMMEERGIVGPLDGAKPRELLVSREEVERMFLRNRPS